MAKLLILVGLLIASMLFFNISANKTPNQLSATALYSSKFNTLEGTTAALAQWQGKILILNFWATWCMPCREEIPMLIKLQQQSAKDNVQIIGIAIDKSHTIPAFANKMGINYPILLGEATGIALSKRLGNNAGALPFTALIDQEGQVIFIKTGLLTAHELEVELQKLI